MLVVIKNINAQIYLLTRENYRSTQSKVNSWFFSEHARNNSFYQDELKVISSLCKLSCKDLVLFRFKYTRRILHICGVNKSAICILWISKKIIWESPLFVPLSRCTQWKRRILRHCLCLVTFPDARGNVVTITLARIYISYRSGGPIER